jgi:hypothetical protein
MSPLKEGVDYNVATYTEKVMEHFTTRTTWERLPDADGIGQVGNRLPGRRDYDPAQQSLSEHRDVPVKERVLTHEGVYSTGAEVRA